MNIRTKLGFWIKKNGFNFIAAIIIMAIYLLADVTFTNIIIIGLIYNILYTQLYNDTQNKRRKLLLKQKEKEEGKNIDNVNEENDKVEFNETLFDIVCNLEKTILTCFLYAMLLIPITAWNVFIGFNQNLFKKATDSFKNSTSIIKYFFELIESPTFEQKIFFLIFIMFFSVIVFARIFEKNKSLKVFSEIIENRKKDSFFEKYRNSNIYSGDEIYLRDFTPKEYQLMKFSKKENRKR